MAVRAPSDTTTGPVRTRIVRHRNQKYHRYEPLDASPQVQDLLD